ncbi:MULTISPECIES: DNA (cytosine-5-)-methyltransferase [Bacilli]|uniref:Cytosine-specific methyltransferase n=1 Tax=Lysinibacillus capsici TaxID=2115968 RepID=A0ABY8KNT4_9BACI|nr:DNA (cytosine-5-)-methyltransferase [Lysinibacillus capsici]WGF40652.1 DNA (cytosine-5-)-methyltransferase [Lysinibacillus capsici]
MLRIIETFSGIGSQVQALKNINIEHRVVATVEWEIGAMYAYDIMHNGPQYLKEYRHHTKESLVNILDNYTLSSDGKVPLSYRALTKLSLVQLKAILSSIERNNNLVDIKSVKAIELPDTDVLTYSFPCQDLSVSGYWHNNHSGIDRDANNRSTLLWEIERILKEFVEIGKALPKFLLMENVSNILSSKHIKNFNEWQNFLENLGYINKIYTLDARNFGIPQSRIRTYLVSVLAENSEQANEINNYFLLNNLENIYLDKEQIAPIERFLRLDYSKKLYYMEAIESTPAFTESRKKIYENNVILATDNIAHNKEHARTITTKQDRHPNSGIIEFRNQELTSINKKYRNLTPRECFLLMGFKEEQYELLMENNIQIGQDRKILSQTKLIQLAGNSIVVQVLESIFNQINEINEKILTVKGQENLVEKRVIVAV